MSIIGRIFKDTVKYRHIDPYTGTRFKGFSKDPILEAVYDKNKRNEKQIDNTKGFKAYFDVEFIQNGHCIVHFEKDYKDKTINAYIDGKKDKSIQLKDCFWFNKSTQRPICIINPRRFSKATEFLLVDMYGTKIVNFALIKCERVYL